MTHSNNWLLLLLQRLLIPKFHLLCASVYIRRYPTVLIVFEFIYHSSILVYSISPFSILCTGLRVVKQYNLSCIYVSQSLSLSLFLSHSFSLSLSVSLSFALFLSLSLTAKNLPTFLFGITTVFTVFFSCF